MGTRPFFVYAMHRLLFSTGRLEMGTRPFFVYAMHRLMRIRKEITYPGIEGRAGTIPSHTYKKPIVTEITPFSNFYAAESYHKDYYDRNPAQAYCRFIIEPKVQKLLKEYRKDVKGNA